MDDEEQKQKQIQYHHFYCLLRFPPSPSAPLRYDFREAFPSLFALPRNTVFHTQLNGPFILDGLFLSPHPLSPTIYIYVINIFATLLGFSHAQQF
jgi:hypothetical protein